MTGYANRHILLSQSLYGITHLCNSLGIKPIDRFIKDQEIRLPDQCQPDSRRCFIPREKCFVFFFPTPSSPTNSQYFFNITFFLYSKQLAFYIQVCICIHVAIQPRCFNQTPHTRTNLCKFFSFTRTSQSLRLSVLQVH